MHADIGYKPLNHDQVNGARTQNTVRYMYVAISCVLYLWSHSIEFRNSKKIIIAYRQSLLTR